jgi:hypothetical protein
VRRPGPESDHHLLTPLEYHSNTSELVQMLRKGHHGVNLERGAWDRIITWIDLNVPDHGRWRENRKIAGDFHERRLESRKLHANIDIDPETIPAAMNVASLPKPPAPKPLPHRSRTAPAPRPLRVPPFLSGMATRSQRRLPRGDGDSRKDHRPSACGKRRDSELSPD